MKLEIMLFVLTLFMGCSLIGMNLETYKLENEKDCGQSAARTSKDLRAFGISVKQIVLPHVLELVRSDPAKGSRC